MVFGSLFRRRKACDQAGQRAPYASGADFIIQNLPMVKAMLSFTGYNDVDRRLANLASLTKCRVVALCGATDGQDKFIVEKSTSAELCKTGQTFTWQHMQPWVSTDYASISNTLPFNDLESSAILSAPVKNERNIIVGVVIGLTADKQNDINSKLQILHLLTPPLEAELRYMKQIRENRLQEMRIASLNQNIEVLNNDLVKERNIATESRKLKSAFLTNLSHEIRTPMNAIMGFMYLVQNSKDDAERNELINIMKQNCHQLLCVIDSLIDISKIQSNYMLKPPCPVQLNELLSEVKQKYEARLRRDGKNVTIDTAFALETPNDTIWNSDEIISKVLDLLMDNACRNTESGKISISYSINHKEATFCVTNTGTGIKPGSEDKIFDLFDEAPDGSGTAENHGKGGGLAIASKYLALANGRIWIDTTYKGGACYYFSIPTEKL